MDSPSELVLGSLVVPPRQSRTAHTSAANGVEWVYTFSVQTRISRPTQREGAAAKRPVCSASGEAKMVNPSFNGKALHAVWRERGHLQALKGTYNQAGISH